MTNETTKASPQVAINDLGSSEDFLAAVEETLKFFNDGDLIEGTVVKRSTATRSFSTSVTRPRVSFPHANFPSSTMLIRTKLSKLATRLKHSFSRKKTKKVDSSSRRSAHNTSVLGEMLRKSKKMMASLPAPLSRLSRAASSLISDCVASFPLLSSSSVVFAT